MGVETTSTIKNQEIIENLKIAAEKELEARKNEELLRTGNKLDSNKKDAMAQFFLEAIKRLENGQDYFQLRDLDNIVDPFGEQLLFTTSASIKRFVRNLYELDSSYIIEYWDNIDKVYSKLFDAYLKKNYHPEDKYNNPKNIKQDLAKAMFAPLLKNLKTDEERIECINKMSPTIQEVVVKNFECITAFDNPLFSGQDHLFQNYLVRKDESIACKDNINEISRFIDKYKESGNQEAIDSIIEYSFSHPRIGQFSIQDCLERLLEHSRINSVQDICDFVKEYYDNHPDKINLNYDINFIKSQLVLIILENHKPNYGDISNEYKSKLLKEMAVVDRTLGGEAINSIIYYRGIYGEPILGNKIQLSNDDVINYLRLTYPGELHKIGPNHILKLMREECKLKNPQNILLLKDWSKNPNNKVDEKLLHAWRCAQIERKSNGVIR